MSCHIYILHMQHKLDPCGGGEPWKQGPMDTRDPDSPIQGPNVVTLTTGAEARGSQGPAAPKAPQLPRPWYTNEPSANRDYEAWYKSIRVLRLTEVAL